MYIKFSGMCHIKDRNVSYFKDTINSSNNKIQRSCILLITDSVNALHKMTVAKIKHNHTLLNYINWICSKECMHEYLIQNITINPGHPKCIVHLVTFAFMNNYMYCHILHNQYIIYVDPYNFWLKFLNGSFVIVFWSLISMILILFPLPPPPPPPNDWMWFIHVIHHSLKTITD